MSILLKLLQFSKALSLIVSTDAGITILVKLVHPLKHSSPILVTPSDIAILDNLLQLWNQSILRYLEYLYYSNYYIREMNTILYSQQNLEFV